MVKRERVRRIRFAVGLLSVVAMACVASAPRALAQAYAAASAHPQAILWTNPADIKERNLYYGPGGEEDQPKGSLRFLKEDMHGTNPKFDVRDSAGTKWRAKLGVEAQPETVATRLLWAVGYVANVNYFVPDVNVEGMPRLRRGQKLIGVDGEVRSVRLQKRPRDAGHKIAHWRWKDNPFSGTREFNGLRIMMALLNNWDLNDSNNAIYASRDETGPALFEVSDVGASFGMAGQSYTARRAKNNLAAYRRSKFISRVTPEYVSFHFPTHPPYLYVFRASLFFSRMRQRWIGQRIPRSDVKWIASLLAQLSPEQICDAFRAAGYSREQVEGLATTVEARIAELERL